MNKVLIFGIDSFTGKHLSVYLKESGYEVEGTSFLKEGKSIHLCDITKKKQITSILDKVHPVYIINLSGISFSAHKNSLDFYKVNTLGTENILSSIEKLQLKPKKIILASSATVYGKQDTNILDEKLTPNPSDHYGISKYAAECIAKNFFTKLPIIITRPFNYTGIGQSDIFLIPKIVNHFKNRKKVIELGNLDVSREFNSISFVCDAYKRLLKCSSTSEVVNIASNRGIKLLDVIDSMNQIAGYKIEVKTNPKFIRKNEIKRLTGSNKKLFEMIGDIKQQPFKYTLKEMYES